MKKNKYIITIALNIVDGSLRYVDFYYDTKHKLSSIDIEIMREELFIQYNKEKNIVLSITILNIYHLGKYKVAR